MLFLANMLSKMKHGTRLGSRIAEVYNGSSLVTGDAGQGESNIRRRIIENDWLKTIVSLPLNMFSNTDVATYIWVLSNRKPSHRQDKVQLIDATPWFKPLCNMNSECTVCTHLLSSDDSHFGGGGSYTWFIAKSDKNLGTKNCE
jgi:type I restriction-modification system DNA methylase subunit